MILDKVFEFMAQHGASDLYVSAGTPIQVKVEGRVVPLNQQRMTPEMTQRIAEELLTPEQSESFRHTKEMNLSLGRQGLGNFRVNLFFQRGTVAICVRYIAGNVPQLEKLLLPAVLSEVILEKRGLVLVVGSTGSGKSTTIAAMINHRVQNVTGHVLTIEDPIEYLFRHGKSVVNQRELGIDTLSTAEALRNAMRQAPDCILIGEIRDRETMAMAMAYAQTGHLCVATLHANNAYHSLQRIINFFPLENRAALLLDLSMSLKCISSQRLVRRRDGTRTPTVEVLLNSRHIADLIERGELNGIREAMEQSLAPGCQTFEQDLYRLYHEEIISIEEALGNSDSPTNLSWLISNGGQPDTPASTPVRPDPQPPAPEASFSEFSLAWEDEGVPHGR